MGHEHKQGRSMHGKRDTNAKMTEQMLRSAKSWTHARIYTSRDDGRQVEMRSACGQKAEFRSPKCGMMLYDRARMFEGDCCAILLFML